MFDGVDPFYQGRARFDGDRLLTDDRAGVEAFVHVVDGYTGYVDAGRQCVGDCLRTRELRQQRRMDVDDPIPERAEKRLREQVHVTGQHDEVDAAELEPVGQLAISRGAIGCPLPAPSRAKSCSTRATP